MHQFPQASPYLETYLFPICLYMYIFKKCTKMFFKKAQRITQHILLNLTTQSQQILWSWVLLHFVNCKNKAWGIKLKSSFFSISLISLLPPTQTAAVMNLVCTLAVHVYTYMKYVIRSCGIWFIYKYGIIVYT